MERNKADGSFLSGYHAERCQRGRMERTANALTPLPGSQGSNPCLSARVICTKPMPRESEPMIEPEAGALTEDARDSKAQGTRELVEQADQEEPGTSEEREESEDRLRLAWDALNEEQRLEVLRGVLHFEDFQRENEKKIQEMPGSSIDAKTQRHILQRQTALAFFIKKGDPRIGGLLRDITTLIPSHHAEGDTVGKAERAVLRRIIAKHAQRLLDAESQGENPEVTIRKQEAEAKPETPEGPEVFSKEIWEHLHAAGFDCVEMPAEKGKEGEQECILYVDPANQNLDPELGDLFHLDEKIRTIRQQTADIERKIKTKEGNAEEHRAAMAELNKKLEHARETASWDQAQEIVKAIIERAFQQQIDQEDSLSMKRKLAAVRQKGMEYPTQMQGSEILKRIKPQFPDHAIVIYKQREPGNEHRLMDISKTGNEIRTRALKDEKKRPMYEAESNTKLFPVMLKISMKRREIEKMELGNA